MRLELLYGLEKPDEKPLRYVCYVRKSSEDAEAQAKSLPDQIADCRKYAKDNDLKIIEPIIQESKSAKKSGNRPLFTQMIKDIERGKYDSILAWHPDRLARNSLEAGMIVDMLDDGVIKDLKFPTLAFSNDSSGKLLLNIRKGWEMLLEDYTRVEIVKYWQEHNVHRMTKISRKNKHQRCIEINE